MRRLIVRALEHTCTITHRLHLDRIPGLPRCTLADWAYRLDEQWGTQAWAVKP